jgi:hypothetical protein
VAERNRRRSRGRWIATLAGFGVLAVFGFGLGLVGGAVWEAPGLVAGYLLGRGEEVAWGAQEPPDVAAAPLATSVVAPDPVPASQGGLAIQVGAFAESGSAERLAESLRAQGFSVYLSPGTGAGDARWRVRVGPLASRDEAERVAARLKRDQKLPTWVLAEDES